MHSLRYLKEIGRTAREEMRALFPSSSKSRSHPLDFVCFGITDDCMFKCKMCQKWKQDIFVKNRLSRPVLADWKRCVVGLRKITDSPVQINFGGGEPLLNQDIFKLVSFCRDKGFQTNIATNAYLIDEEMARKIGDSGLTSIIISLDSLHEETHDYLRGVKGAYRQVMKAIDLLDKHCKELYKGICCVIYEMNKEDVLEVAEWVEQDSRLHSIYFMAAMQPNNTALDSRWFKSEEYALLWPKDHFQILVLIDELIARKRGRSKITNQACQLEAFKLYYRAPERFVKSSKCNLDSALHISSTGDIFLCYRWAKLGNIATDDLCALWDSKKAGAVRQTIAACKDNCHFLLNCFFQEEYPFETAA